MSNRTNNGRPRRQLPPPAAAVDLTQPTTVAVATGAKVHLSRPDQLNGRPCMLLTFTNDGQEHMPILLIDGIDNFDQATHMCATDIQKLFTEMVEGTPAEGISKCGRCGTRIFGDLVEAGFCGACQKALAAAAEQTTPALRVLEGGAGE